MAFQIKYRCEFTDYLKLQWKIEFLTNPWAGAITNLMATDDPCKIEFLSDSDEFNEPVKPSKAVINVWSTTNFALLDFYSDQDLKIKCNIYTGAVLYWTGWVVTGEYSEPYDCVPYPVQITAIDGLNYLKNILYDNGATPPVYYNGRILESQIIIDILAKIQITTFTEYVNIYEAEMSVSVNDSPMDQLKIDVDIFQDMYCYEVLQELLKKYNAIIRQSFGVINIYRPTELVQATIYGRIFTGPTTKSTTSYSPAQSINRVGSASSFLQFPGSILMIKPPVKKITLSQDYGYKESWIDNWEAKLNTYNAATDSYESWTNKAGGAIYQLANKFAGQELGFAMVSNSIAIGSRFYIKQIFGSYTLSSTDVFIFSFDYLHHNKTAAAITVSVIIRIESNAGSKYLYITSDTTAGWDVSLNYITFNDVAPVGKSEWRSFSRQVIGIPASGDYTIYIYDPTGPTGDTATLIKNIRFYSTSDEIIGLSWQQKINPRTGLPYFSAPLKASTPLILKEIAPIVLKEYIITNALNGKELAFNYLLGDVTDANIDNVTEQFAGSLATWIGGSYFTNALAWNTRSPNGENDPLIELIGGEIGQQYSRPKQLIQMNIKETTAETLNVIGSVQDSLNQVDAVNRKFVFNAGEFSIKMRSWTADLLEII